MDVTTRTGDVLDVLMQEHREIEDLLIRLRHSGPARARRATADKLIASIVRHSIVEEILVVPLVRDYLIHGEESVAHDLGEHEELEKLLRALEALDGADPRFMEVVLELQAALAHHFAVEEGQQFPAVRRAAPRHELVALRGRAQVIGRVEPAGSLPDGGSAVVVDPGEGMVDRIRDALAARQPS